MNTATYRAIAQKAEKELDWVRAAANWLRAIDHYPNPDRGALAKADVARMKERQRACAIFNPDN